MENPETNKEEDFDSEEFLAKYDFTNPEIVVLKLFIKHILIIIINS